MKKEDGELSFELYPSPHPEGGDDPLPEKFEVPAGITFENTETNIRGEISLPSWTCYTKDKEKNA